MSYSGTELTTIAVASTITVLAILLVAILVVVFLIHRRKREADPSATREDENPVYGIYYFSDGGKIDDGTMEVTDENEVYDIYDI